MQRVETKDELFEGLELAEGVERDDAGEALVGEVDSGEGAGGGAAGDAVETAYGVGNVP